MVETVHEIHTKGFLHRDLKPHNVLLELIDDGDPIVKIADFGLAEAISRDDSELRTSICGTPGFIAPEVLKLEKYDEKSDIFGLGSLLYFMLTGHLLFSASTQKMVLQLNLKCKTESQLNNFFSSYQD